MSMACILQCLEFILDNNCKGRVISFDRRKMKKEKGKKQPNFRCKKNTYAARLGPVTLTYSDQEEIIRTFLNSNMNFG